MAKRRQLQGRELVPPPDDYLADGESYWEYRSRLTRGQEAILKNARQKNLLRFLVMVFCFLGLLAWLSYWTGPS